LLAWQVAYVPALQQQPPSLLEPVGGSYEGFEREQGAFEAPTSASALFAAASAVFNAQAHAKAQAEAQVHAQVRCAVARLACAPGSAAQGALALPRSCCRRG
jgi:hypothetical protein